MGGRSSGPQWWWRPDHETKVAVAGPAAAAAAMVVAEGFNCCQETKLSRKRAREMTGKSQVTADL